MTALSERIREMPPHWAGETIRPFDEDLLREGLPFVLRRYWCASGSVNAFRIVGTRHPDYKNMTWRWMIENGRRIRENLALHETNPGYYLETSRKVPEMTFITTDGLDFYVSTDGNHRSAIARFDFHYRGITTLHGVAIEDIRIDRELLEGYRNISRLIRESRLPLLSTPVSEKLSREDTAGWMLEIFRVRIRIEDAEGQTFLDDTEAVAEWIRKNTPRPPENRKKWGIFR